MAQIVAVEPGVLIGGILNTFQPMLVRILMQFVLRERQQRPGQSGLSGRRQAALRRDASQLRRPAPAHQIQQYRLDLVVGMVRGTQHIAGLGDVVEPAVAAGAGGGFRAVRVGGRRSAGLGQQRDLPRGAQPPAMRLPGIRFGIQPMVEVRRDQLKRQVPAQSVQRMQQYSGIPAAAVRDNQSLAGQAANQAGEGVLERRGVKQAAQAG